MSISRFNTALPTPAKGTVGGEEVFVDAHRVRVRYRLVWTALSKMAGRRNVSLAQRGGISSSGSAMTSGFAPLHPPPPKKKNSQLMYETDYVREADNVDTFRYPSIVVRSPLARVAAGRNLPKMSADANILEWQERGIPGG